MLQRHRKWIAKLVTKAQLLFWYDIQLATTTGVTSTSPTLGAKLLLAVLPRLHSLKPVCYTQFSMQVQLGIKYWILNDMALEAHLCMLSLT